VAGIEPATRSLKEVTFLYATASDPAGNRTLILRETTGSFTIKLQDRVTENGRLKSVFKQIEVSLISAAVVVIQNFLFTI
jgi:hypothetical protein